jgi:hypothetical protein
MSSKPLFSSGVSANALGRRCRMKRPAFLSPLFEKGSPLQSNEEPNVKKAKTMTLREIVRTSWRTLSTDLQDVKTQVIKKNEDEAAKVKQQLQDTGASLSLEIQSSASSVQEAVIDAVQKAQEEQKKDDEAKSMELKNLMERLLDNQNQTLLTKIEDITMMKKAKQGSSVDTVSTEKKTKDAEPETAAEQQKKKKKPVNPTEDLKRKQQSLAHLTSLFGSLGKVAATAAARAWLREGKNDCDITSAEVEEIQKLPTDERDRVQTALRSSKLGKQRKDQSPSEWVRMITEQVKDNHVIRRHLTAKSKKIEDEHSD